jgi:hypothetical protein
MNIRRTGPQIADTICLIAQPYVADLVDVASDSTAGLRLHRLRSDESVNRPTRCSDSRQQTVKNLKKVQVTFRQHKKLSVIGMKTEQSKME